MSQLNVTSLKHESASGDNITLSSNGNVGIGTSNPTSSVYISYDSGTTNEWTNAGQGLTIQNASTTKPASLKLVNPTGGQQIVWGGSNGDSALAFKNYGAERMRIDSEGRVTMPYQPAFSYVGTSYSQSTSTWSIVIPATTVLNRGGHYNGSTGVFTAPVDGYYVFGFWGLSYPHYNGETNSLQYWKNGGSGSNNIQFNGASSAHALASGGWGVYLYANDTVDLRYYRGSGSAYAYPSQWNMWGYLAN